MARIQSCSALLVAVAVAIGCGSGKSQNASAGSTNAGAPQATSAQPAAAPSQGAPDGSASITGTIRLDGQAPKGEAVKMNADPACQAAHPTPLLSEDIAVTESGLLKHVFVYAKEGVKGTYPAPATPVQLDQAGCWYTPHVFGIQANQPLEIVNSDATLHNVNAKPAANQPFNVAQPVKGMKTTKKFAKPEIMVSFKCNVHPWMHAYAGVVEHPFFAVSGADGSFTISGLPAGTYVLEAWQEKLGTQSQTVTVGEGESKSVELTFKAP